MVRLWAAFSTRSAALGSSVQLVLQLWAAIQLVVWFLGSVCTTCGTTLWHILVVRLWAVLQPVLPSTSFFWKSHTGFNWWFYEAF